MEKESAKLNESVGDSLTLDGEQVLNSDDDLFLANDSNSGVMRNCEIGVESKNEAYKFIEGSITFREYKAVVEGKDQEEDGDGESKKLVKQERNKRVRKFLPPALEGLMGQANMCFVKGDHESALQMCLEIIRQVPSAPEPFQTLAELYEEKGLKEKSLQVAMIAAHLNPRDSEQWIHLGERSLQLNNLNDAITCYSRAVKYDPTNVNAHIVKSQLLERKGDRKGAIKSYHKLVESVKPELGSQILDYAKIAAHYYHEDNDVQKAKEVMDAAFSKVPHLVASEDVNLYVELLMMLKDYMKALEMIAKYCDVKIEGEEDIVADEVTNQLACSSFRVLCCEVPEEIPIQIHVKLIVILIHLKACHLFDGLLAPFLEIENVEKSGDLYIDIVEAFISEGMHIEALKLLKLLTESKNYSLPAVWLNYAECLKHLGRLEEAVSAYLMVMQQAPKHVEARLMVSQLLNELGRSDEAITVLTQDPNSGSMDAGLLYERGLLLNGYNDRTDEFLAVGRLLLSRHCVRIKRREDLKLLSKLKGPARKQEAMKKSYDMKAIEGPELVEGKRLPTQEEEWSLFLSLIKTAYESKQFALLQRLAFSALGSPVLNSNEKKEASVFFIALLSCLYNKDSFHGYNFSKEMILTNNNPKVWNLFNLMLLDSEDSRHYRFVMRQLSRKPNHPALIMLYANNCFISGTYKYSLSEYMSAYRQEPSGILAFMICVTLLQMSCQKFSDKKNLLITQCIAFLWQYKELRGYLNDQEVHYNMGRLFHQLGLFPAALFHYKKALHTKSMLVEANGVRFDLKREIAFNISLIYQSSGSLELAKHYGINLVQNCLDSTKMTKTLAKSISFRNFCQLCSKLRSVTKNKRLDALNHYIDNWKKKGIGLKEKEPQLDDSIFPAFRLLLPQLDRGRGPYGIKEYTLARIYIRILSLPKDGQDATKLLEYRSPNSAGSNSCDFAEVAYMILQNRCGEGSNLSIEDVNKYLDKIAESHASNKPRAVDSVLTSLLAATSAEEQKWLIRILLKQVKLGLGHNAILHAYHSDARDLYDTSNNLKKVCDLLKNNKIRLNEIQIELFTPFKPMLCESCDVKKIDYYFNRSPYFYVETKLDGERFQIHMKEGIYKYFSRNGFDYTTNFGATSNEGILTPRLAGRFRKEITSFIIDGEMISWNPKSRTFSYKGQNVDVKNLKEVDIHQPCFCVFDVLLCNNEVLTNKPLSHRLEILQKIVQPLQGTITFFDRKRISAGNEVIECLNEAIDNREEGVVLKEYMSVYKPNVRKNGGWYKIKPEYTDELVDTLDLLIIGGYIGRSRRKGTISHFLLGVAVKLDDRPLFYAVARVGSGYSKNELAELLMKLEPNWKSTKAGEMPVAVQWTKEKPDVWIDPEKSIILEVKASEIMPSDLFKTGYTLRFPRVEKIRYDKSWKSCLTLNELLEKIQNSCGKLATSHFTAAKSDNILSKKKTRASEICIQNKAAGLTDVVCLSSLLMNKEICVFTGFANIDKNKVEKKIIEFGGTVVKNPGKRTFCILAESDSTTRIKNAIKYKCYDIIYTSWFYSQLHFGNLQLPEPKPDHFLSISNQTEQLFQKSYDEYGDHYITPATSETIKFLLSKIKNDKVNIELTSDEKYNMDIDLYCGSSPNGIFRNCIAYFDQFINLSDPSEPELSDLDLCKIDFRFRGGNCSEVISKEVTHVVVYSKNLTRLQDINGINRMQKTKFHVVTEDWIYTSIAKGSLSCASGFN